MLRRPAFATDVGPGVNNIPEHARPSHVETPGGIAVGNPRQRMPGEASLSSLSSLTAGV
jgi:hypothetical protein